MIPPAAWTWDDCNVEPVTFVIEQMLKEPVGIVEQCDEAACYEMPVYSPPSFVVGELWDAPPYPDSRVLPPPLGAVTMWGVEAMDEAGNVSGGEGCP